MAAELLDRAGWTRGSLDRIAVGTGPGSFTGLRIGLALAQGLGLALDLPVVGVGSLDAMSAALDPAHLRDRWCVLDAKREEAFFAGFDGEGRCLLPPRLIAVDALRSLWAQSGQNTLVLGQAAEALLPGCLAHPGDLTDFPHAIGTARLGARLSPEEHPAVPAYLREPDATLPNLPPSPLATPAR